MSVSSKLTTIAPQFDTADNRDEFISIAQSQVNSCSFGTNADLATAYLAAHYIQVTQDSALLAGTSGEITSKKEGDLSISYGNFSPKSGGGLDATTWGRQFKAIRDSSMSFIGITGGSDLYVC